MKTLTAAWQTVAKLRAACPEFAAEMDDIAQATHEAAEAATSKAAKTDDLWTGRALTTQAERLHGIARKAAPVIAAPAADLTPPPARTLVEWIAIINGQDDPEGVVDARKAAQAALPKHAAHLADVAGNRVDAIVAQG